MKKKSITLLILITLTLSLTSCQTLRKKEKREEIPPKVIKLSFEEQELYCVPKHEFKILLKEAGRE